MRAITALVGVVYSLLLVGCGTSAVVKSEYRLSQDEKLKLQLSTPATASKEGVAIFRERLSSQLAAKGLLASADDVSSRILDVTVTTYTMRDGATRVMLGIMAGSDNIQSTVQIKDQSSGKILAEFAVESKNSTAWGTSRGLIEEHADEIVATLMGTKR